MSWTYVLLIALLLRITTAGQSNPFTVAAWNVVAGTTFTITWEPTTEGTVTLALISTYDFKDPKLNALSASIPNSGLFDWFVTDSNPSLLYTIQLQSDSNGHLINFSPTFSISNAKSREGNADASLSTTTESPINDVPTSTTPPIPSYTESDRSSSTAVGAPSADTRTSGSSLLPESSNPSSAGLSTGAAVGIGVGATLGALILMAIGGYFWWRQREGSSKPEIGTFVSALDVIESVSKKRASELEGTGKIPVELEGTPRAELES